jgi:hypothetical protein
MKVPPYTGQNNTGRPPRWQSTRLHSVQRTRNPLTISRCQRSTRAGQYVNCTPVVSNPSNFLNRVVVGKPADVTVNGGRLL